MDSLYWIHLVWFLSGRVGLVKTGLYWIGMNSLYWIHLDWFVSGKVGLVSTRLYWIGMNPYTRLVCIR
jgi:hypothetical protein